MSLAMLRAACPSCPPVVEARALVFSEAFWSNLTYAVLPFLVVGVAVHVFVKCLDRGGSREQDH